MGLFGELAAALIGAAIDGSAEEERVEMERRNRQEAYEQQLELEQKRQEEAKRQRRHENATLIINGIFHYWNRHQEIVMMKTIIKPKQFFGGII